MKLAITLIFILLISCNNISVIDLPESKPRIVLNSSTQDGTNWQIGVTESDGILALAPPFVAIKNATVMIFENDLLSETIENTSDFEGRYFFKNSYPIPGNSYRVEVTAPEFEGVSASYVQPLAITADSLIVTIIGDSPNNQNGKDVSIRVFFEDPPDDNYYIISIKRKTENDPFPSGAQSLGLTFMDPTYREESGNSKEPIFKDNKFNGNTAIIDFRSIIFEIPGDPQLPYYAVTIKTVTSEYYEYLKTANLQNYTRSDPFAQPVLVSGNVSNGFGIFTGYTKTERTWKLN